MKSSDALIHFPKLSRWRGPQPITSMQRSTLGEHQVYSSVQDTHSQEHTLSYTPWGQSGPYTTNNPGTKPRGLPLRHHAQFIAPSQTRPESETKKWKGKISVIRLYLDPLGIQQFGSSGERYYKIWYRCDTTDTWINPRTTIQ